MRIFLDLDDVLVEFVQSVCSLHGLSVDPRPPGTYWVHEAMGLSLESFIAPILERGAAFWETLPLTPWALPLISIVQKYDSEYFIVSAPMDEASMLGKARWVRKYIGPPSSRLILTTDKWKLAHASAVLIDDSELQVTRFAAAGGRAILFPSRSNQLYHLSSTHSALNYVKDQLRSLSHLIDLLTKQSVES